jgi:hypothetical protein
MIDDTEKGGAFVIELNALDKTMPPPALTIERPAWPDVEAALERAFQHGGFVRVRVLKPDIAFTDLLEMVSLPGQFKLVALTKFIDPKAELREWWEPGETEFRGTVCFGDDDCDARMVSSDISVAKRLFRDLFVHGELTDASFIQMRSAWDPKP